MGKQSTRAFPSVAVPFNEHYKYDTHRLKVRQLYKKCIRTVEHWTWHSQSSEVRIWELVILRQRFDKHRFETDMIKASGLLKAGEEEWFVNRHPVPIIFPSTDGGVSFQRGISDRKQSGVLANWLPEDRARFPDMYEKYQALQK